ERRRQLEPLLDAVEPRRDQRRERQVRVDVTARNPGLDPRRGPVADDAETAGAVVVAPGQRRRRPRSGRVALVRVDRRREEERELTRAGDPAGEKLLEDMRLPGERVLPVAPEARVDVARAADPRVVRLG